MSDNEPGLDRWLRSESERRTRRAIEIERTRKAANPQLGAELDAQLAAEAEREIKWAANLELARRLEARPPK